MKSRVNKFEIGAVLGFLAPVLGFVLVYLFSFRNLSLSEFFEFLVERRKLSSVISLSAIPNLLLFFIFIWLNYLYSARGVLASTFLLALVVIITKFVF